MTEAQRAAFARANVLLTSALNASWWRPPPSAPETYSLPWPDRDDVGICIRGVADRLTPDVVRWFRNQGWLAVSYEEDILAAPMVEIDPPECCFHLTPMVNEDSILHRGLMRGADAGCSTTNRPDACQYIHVTFEIEAAEKWTEEKLLGQHNPNGGWVLFRIDRRGIEGKVYLDPASETGFILEAEVVKPQHLSLARRWSTRCERPG